LINTDRIIVVGDKILIKPEEENQKTISGLYHPPGVSEKEKVQSGYVVKVGPGYPLAAPLDEDEPWKEKKSVKYIPLQAHEGDYTIFLRRDAVEIELDGQKLVIVPQSSILILLRDDLLSF